MHPWIFSLVAVLPFSAWMGEEPDLAEGLPSPESFFAAGVGERHLYHHEIFAYLDALAAAADRVEPLGVYARSHGGRDLAHWVISSPRNLARLDSIRETQQRLVAGEAVDLSDQPAILLMGYGVHGNEPSAATVTPWLAYYLAASGETRLAEWLDAVVILLDPVMNPDGHDRFTAWTAERSGRTPNPDPQDWEHTEGFPGSRTNYYWFDLNRDWLPAVHPSSEGRLRRFHEWKPNVLLDYHEMGTGSSYFFQPGVPERTHPLTPQENQDLTDRLADFHRSALDRAYEVYFTRERFDDFYMGKGSTYPDLHGAVGILFEQASARGQVQDRDRGRLYFRDAIANQFRTSLSSIEGTAELRRELQAFQQGFFEEARARGAAIGGAYLLSAPEDPARLLEFARILRLHDIAVHELALEVEVDGRVYRPGEALAVPTAQTGFRYLEAIMERRKDFPEEIFYDVSTWPLGLAFDLVHAPEPVSLPRGVIGEAFGGGRAVSIVPDEASSFGYLVDWRRFHTPRLLHSLIDAGVRVRVATRDFTMTIDEEEVDFPPGTLFVPILGDEDLAERAFSLIREVAGEHPQAVHAVSTSAVVRGIDLGSDSFQAVPTPRFAMLVGFGVNPLSAGEIWHYLDYRMGIPLTRIPFERVRGANLRDYSVVILGDGVYSELSGAAINRLRDYVRDGGTLLAVGRAVEWAVNNNIATAKVREAPPPARPEGRARPFAEAERDFALNLVSGAVFEAYVDRTHPMGYGFPQNTVPLFRTRNLVLEPSDNPFGTPLQFTESPLLSGYASEANQAHAALGAAGLMVRQGGGRVIFLADNPTFRGYWWASHRLLANSLFFGPLMREPRWSGRSEEAE
ncbi:MAG: hypothetical protein JJT96_13560 [Opitutales bacterium]|nr:hypothetical protein [Opitutales bacterium]